MCVPHTCRQVIVGISTVEKKKVDLLKLTRKVVTHF